MGEKLIPEDIELKEEEQASESDEINNAELNSSRVAQGIKSEITKTLAKKIETPEQFPCYILQLESSEIEPYIKELADSFRETFNNGFGQFAFYPSNGEPISYQEAMVMAGRPRPQEKYVAIEEMDKFDLNELRNHTTGEVPVFWHNPDVTEEILRKKLCKENGYASFLMSKENDKLLGAIFARVCTVKEEFESEEWENPFLYSGIEDNSTFRKLDEMLSILNKEVEKHEELSGYLQETGGRFSEDTKVFGWNNMYVHPSIRKSGQLLQMTKSFFDMVGDLKNQILILGETMYNSHAYNIFRNSGLIDIHGYLADEPTTDEDMVLLVGPLGPVADAFSLTGEKFRELGKRTGAFGN